MSPTSTDQTAAKLDPSTTPMSIGMVTLKVRDLEPMAAFYRSVIGLAEQKRTDSGVILGVDNRHLLELVASPNAAGPKPGDAGLFHTAFLLPTRADLGRWLRFAEENGVSLHGASDHAVSEALYLADPEGNGIEIYADRPQSEWRHGDDGALVMPTDPLDLADLDRAGHGDAWAGMPSGSTIGHLHLKVGDVASANRFYRDILELEVMCHYPGASFYGSGGYHHHLAANVWQSRGAQPRDPAHRGLDRFELVVADPANGKAIIDRAGAAGLAVEQVGASHVLHDPNGIALTVTA